MTVDQLSKLPGNAVTVRGLSPELKGRLRVRAAHNARSMEAEARAILEATLSAPDDEDTDLGAFARGLFAPLGGVDLELPPRSSSRHPPKLDAPEEAPSETIEMPTADIKEPVNDVGLAVAQTSTRRRRR